MNSNRKSVNILWYKRDLRLTDHLPLKEALLSRKEGERVPLLMIYCFEPSLVSNQNYSERHWNFVSESLEDLNQQLKSSDSQSLDDPEFTKIWIFNAEVQDVFESIQSEFSINEIYSHQETGIRLTYERDKAIKQFCEKQGIKWNEYQSNGIIRGLKNRKGWTALWFKMVQEPLWEVDLSEWIPPKVAITWFEKVKGEVWSVGSDSILPSIQHGGETWGIKYLNSFLQNRIVNYDKHISKPLESRKSCSRLSPYLAWGCLSTKQVYQSYSNPNRGGQRVTSRLFMERLRAQNYFVQVFESDDSMEFENVNKEFDTLNRVENQEFFNAWKNGTTGYPLVDASMRCLNSTGYLNFRMRALLVSFLTHHLFQDWKEGAFHLAKQFTDFEPGIHYSQFQLQIGMFGSEKQPIRIYNPTKQSIEHDPEGIFIKTWIPELKNCPIAYIHTPWKIPDLEQELYDCKIGKDYPHPIIDASKAATFAKSELYPRRSYYKKFPK